MQPLRALGPLVAWGVAVVCGWKVSEYGDLLDAILRGAAAWLGVLTIWLIGVAVCERLIGSEVPAFRNSNRDAQDGQDSR
jgi:hypothetical protein